jgi:hypothetical protein
MRERRRILAGTDAVFAILVLASILALGASVATAQTRPSIDARTWRPSSDPESSIVLEPAATPGPGLWNVGAWLSYAQSPVDLYYASTGTVAARPVLRSVGFDLVAGLGLGKRVSVGLDLPFFIWQEGSGVEMSIVSGGIIPSTGVGDLGVSAKTALVLNTTRGLPAGFGLSAMGSLSLPTGNRASFQGEGAVTVSAALGAEYAFVVGAIRATVGYFARTQDRTWPDASLGGLVFGDAIPWSAGVVLRPGAIVEQLDNADRQLWELAAHGALPAGPVAPFGSGAPPLSPALLALDDRVALGHVRDVFLLVGAELGLDQAVGVPLVRGIVAVGWAPRPHDRDGDGVPDDVDECPDLAEDRDGIQDADGCPEDDADSDGILDEKDACPLAAGVPSSDPRKNGCPVEEAPDGGALNPDAGEK